MNSGMITHCVEVWSTMHLKSAFILCLLGGVFGADTGNTESVWVMLGDSVTLHTGIGSVRRDHHIIWRFGPDSPDSQIAELMKWSYMLSVFVSGKMPFRDTLQLDHRTGSLTINNITPEHSGLYKLTIIHNRKTSRKKFDVKVYAPLPVPIISADSFQNSHRSTGSACVLMCSVTNASWVTLSFFKGSDLVSSISGSDFSSSLSLPLDVESLDENSYSCVVNNSISNHTTLLNTTHLCQPHPAASAPLPVPIISADSFQNSHRSTASACVLMCSVTNASRVTLSFFKGSDLVSSISGSDFGSSLSLPLDVESLDENTYSCVVNNSISNHTTLFNTTHLCQPHPAASDESLLYWLLLLLLLIPVTVIVVLLCVFRKQRKAEEETDDNC